MKKFFGAKEKGSTVVPLSEATASSRTLSYLSALQPDSETLGCPICAPPLSESNQIGAGDDAAVMANLGVMQVKLRCPGCSTVFDVTIPRAYEWKASIDIPGWGRFPE
jgi:hypothetical protein